MVARVVVGCTPPRGQRRRSRPVGVGVFPYWGSVPQPQSARSTSAGSTNAARLAGTQLAIAATTTSEPHAMASAAGFSALAECWWGTSGRLHLRTSGLATAISAIVSNASRGPITDSRLSWVESFWFGSGSASVILARPRIRMRLGIQVAGSGPGALSVVADDLADFGGCGGQLGSPKNTGVLSALKPSKRNCMFMFSRILVWFTWWPPLASGALPPWRKI